MSGYCVCTGLDADICHSNDPEYMPITVITEDRKLHKVCSGCICRDLEYSFSTTTQCEYFVFSSAQYVRVSKEDIVKWHNQHLGTFTKKAV